MKRREPSYCQWLLVGAVIGSLAWLSFPPSVKAADSPDVEAIKLKLELQRREAAEQELKRLRERRTDLQSQLEYAQRWALTNYGLDERGLVRRPERVSAYMKRHEQTKRTTTVALLEQRERFRGSIAKGTALNFLLQECGAVAFDHTFYRTAVKNGGAGQKLEQELLKQVSAQYTLDDNTIRHIRYQRGLTGGKLTGRLNEGPLDLNWPSALRQSQYEVLCKHIELLRDRIVEQLKQGKPVDSKTADELLDRVQELVKRSRQETLRKLPTSRGDYQTVQRNYAAERFCQLLVAGSYRLIEARDVRDITVENFEGGNIEDLIAFMYRHNLTFAESDSNGESAYNMLFELLTRYYVDLQSLRLAIKESDQEVTQLERQEQTLAEIARGDHLSNIQKTEIGLKLIEGVIGGFKAIEETQKTKGKEADARRIPPG